MAAPLRRHVAVANRRTSFGRPEDRIAVFIKGRASVGDAARMSSAQSNGKNSGSAAPDSARSEAMWPAASSSAMLLVASRPRRNPLCRPGIRTSRPWLTDLATQDAISLTSVFFSPSGRVWDAARATAAPAASQERMQRSRKDMAANAAC